MTRSRLAAPLLACASLLVASCWPFDGGECSSDCNLGEVKCSRLSSNDTALNVLHQARDIAKDVLGTQTPTWMGAFAGVKITREGKPYQEPDTLTVLGQTTKVYVAGWVLKFCSGQSAVVFGGGPEVSSSEKSCQDVDCSKVTETVEPPLDAAAIIAAAFPGDSADTLYALEFAPLAHNGERLWYVTRNPNGPVVKVNADTGAVVP